MAKKSLQASSPQPLLRSRAAVEKHRGLLNAALVEILGSKSPQVVQETVGGLTHFFGNEGCERTERRGKTTNAFPLAEIRADQFLWVGFQERWDQKNSTFQFRELGLTFFVGLRGRADKRQIFRAEWPGFRVWQGTADCFQGEDAGHPHWQMDYDEPRSQEELANELRRRLRGDAAIREFSESDVAVAEDKDRLKIERVHFASAAHWWRSNGKDDLELHAHAPQDEQHLRKWTCSCIRYVRREARRLS